jgi:hypothetical protein
MDPEGRLAALVDEVGVETASRLGRAAIDAATAEALLDELIEASGAPRLRAATAPMERPARVARAPEVPNPEVPGSQTEPLPQQPSGSVIEPLMAEAAVDASEEPNRVGRNPLLEAEDSTRAGPNPLAADDEPTRIAKNPLEDTADEPTQIAANPLADDGEPSTRVGLNPLDGADDEPTRVVPVFDDEEEPVELEASDIVDEVALDDADEPEPTRVAPPPPPPPRRREDTLLAPNPLLESADDDEGMDDPFGDDDAGDPTMVVDPGEIDDGEPEMDRTLAGSLPPIEEEDSSAGSSLLTSVKKLFRKS